MHETAQHARARQLLQVGARLTATLAEALDLSYPETSSYEVVERDAPNHEVAPGLGRGELHTLRRQLLQRLGLYQRQVVAVSAGVGERPGAALIPVASQPAGCECLCCRNDRHLPSGLRSYRDLLDDPYTGELARWANVGPALGIMRRQHERDVYDLRRVYRDGLEDDAE